MEQSLLQFCLFFSSICLAQIAIGAGLGGHFGGQIDFPGETNNPWLGGTLHFPGFNLTIGNRRVETTTKCTPTGGPKRNSSQDQGRCSAPWNSTERQAILSDHNDLRSNISLGKYVAKTDRKPPAKNMQEMKYNCSLEARAHAWAATCPGQHSDLPPDVGESLFWINSTTNSVNGLGVLASKTWENQFQIYGWPSNNDTEQLRLSGIVNALQMAWHNSSTIGCGVNNCPSYNAQYEYISVVVCQYYPAGNIINANVYEEGVPCTACDAGTSCDPSTGLWND